MSFLQGLLGPPDVEKMNGKKLWKLMAALGLAVISLLLLFLLLGQITVGAAPGEKVTIADLNANSCVCSRVWVSETVDSGGWVGSFTSLALAPTYPYTPHISYHNATRQSLKHAWLSGTTWFSETVDPIGGKRTTSLALVPTYPHTPCISYHDPWGYWAVKFAYWNGTTWISDVVEGGHFQGEGGTSLALEPTYPHTPHISYNLPWAVYDLKHTYLSGTVWMSGTWVPETVDSNGAVGFDSSLTLEPTRPYTPHISYYDYTNGDLKYAWRSGTTWLSETVDSEGNIGRWSTSLALDTSHNPHISYYDSTNLDLKYAWRSGTTWLSETVDSAGDVGKPNSLALDNSDNPYISYYDHHPNYDLKLAHFNGTVWITQTVDSGGWVGQYSSLALDQAGCPHISYYDATNGDLKYAYIPTVCKIYLPIIMKNR
jgi:hypothetical protein